MTNLKHMLRDVLTVCKWIETYKSSHIFIKQQTNISLISTIHERAAVHLWLRLYSENEMQLFVLSVISDQVKPYLERREQFYCNLKNTLWKRDILESNIDFYNIVIYPSTVNYRTLWYIKHLMMLGQKVKNIFFFISEQHSSCSFPLYFRCIYYRGRQQLCSEYLLVLILIIAEWSRHKKNKFTKMKPYPVYSGSITVPAVLSVTRWGCWRAVSDSNDY